MMLALGVLTLWFTVLTFWIVSKQSKATIQITRMGKWEDGGAQWVEDFCVDNASWVRLFFVEDFFACS